MVDQARKSHQDARTLAVQGKLQRALQCMDRAIENNPLDPSLFLFRCGPAGASLWPSCVLSGSSGIHVGLSFPMEPLPIFP